MVDSTTSNARDADDFGTGSVSSFAREQIAKWILAERLATDLPDSAKRDYFQRFLFASPVSIVECDPSSSDSRDVIARLEYAMALMRVIGDTSSYNYEHGSVDWIHELVARELEVRPSEFVDGLSFLLKNRRTKISDDAIAAFARASAELSVPSNQQAVRDLLVRLLSDSDPLVVDAAVIALSVGELGDPAAIPYLRAAAQTTKWPTLKAEIIDTISELEMRGGGDA